jgi:hypothetical protein
MKKFLIFLFIISFHSHAQDTIPATKSVIALDKMNVVYHGVENQISIAVNNAKSYVIYGNGVSKNKEGKYVIKPISSNETSVFVEIENFDGSKVIEEHVFRVLTFGPHYFTLKDLRDNGNLVFYIEDLVNAKVGFEIENFLFPIDFEVTSFNIKVPGYTTLTIIGNSFTNEVYELLKKARKKDIILISEIKFKNFGISGCFKSSPITFKIIK